MEKKLYDQPTDSDIKRYEDIRKLTKGQGEDYTTRCLLDYEYIKIIIDCKWNVGPKEIQQIEFIKRLKEIDPNGDATDAVADQSMFVLTILQKIK